MGLRFRKSFKLAPGVRMNIGLRGLSMSLGPRGASVSLGARGVYSNVGIPGTGLSFRERIDGSSPGRSAASSPPSLAGKAVSFRLQDDGSVEIVDPEGNPLPARVIKLARTQNEQMLRSWLEEKCAHWNQGIEALLGIHLTTPRPDRPLDTQRKPFKEPRPDEPQLKPLGFWGRLFRHRREQIERSNAQAMEAHASATLTWERERIEHNERETQRLHLLDASAVPNHEEAQEYLSAALAQIEWPRETTVSLEVNPDVTGVLIDVDLPEIEDMPEKSASVAGRGLKLSIKDRSPTERRRDYMKHIHAVAFRVIGEIFAALPRIQRVVCSAFSQRPNPATGQVSDEYLFSLRVSRPQWSTINFSRLSDIDLPSCLGQFEIRRELTSTGVFKAIEPFDSLSE